MTLPGAHSTGLGLTVVFGTAAALCFYTAALGPLAPRRRAGVALVGIVIDWVPVAAGWMRLAGEPSAGLYAIHMGLGVLGYALLGYCLVGWMRGRPRSRRVRVAFLAVWTPAYLAGLLMGVGWTPG